MQIKDLMNRKMPEIPKDIERALDHPNITMTEFENKNAILVDETLQQEVGYGFFEDGSALVSMTCPMPGVTAEMINWWMWWHTQANERYQVWFPGAHFTNTYAKKDAAYFEQPTMPVFQPNDQYPKESIGDMTGTLVIKFKHPENMGFDRKLIEENHFGTNGLHGILSIDYPYLTPSAIMNGHKLHLAIEFSNWMERAAECILAKRNI